MKVMMNLHTFIKTDAIIAVLCISDGIENEPQPKNSPRLEENYVYSSVAGNIVRSSVWNFMAEKT